jgi:uncharacterized membrane protein YvbJ
MLNFIDCPHCGKRVREDAPQCHRCGKRLAQRRTVPPAKTDGNEDGGSPEHAASHGGYDSHADDFDYDEFVQEEFGVKKKKKNLWYYVAWILIVVLSLPIIFQALQLWKGF